MGRLSTRIWTKSSDMHILLRPLFFFLFVYSIIRQALLTRNQYPLDSSWVRKRISLPGGFQEKSHWILLALMCHVPISELVNKQFLMGQDSQTEDIPKPAGMGNSWLRWDLPLLCYFNIADLLIYGKNIGTVVPTKQFRPLWELLQFSKLSPMMKIQKSLVFLWAKPISEHR